MPFSDIGLFCLAGAHTTTSLLTTFTLAMVLFPEVQKKVQEELDRVVGKGRLPDFGDLNSLPYLVATIRETVRWNPTTPIGELLSGQNDKQSLIKVFDSCPSQFD